MNELPMKVLVCRPARVPAPPPIELRRPDFCEGRDGDLLTPHVTTCADPETCGCGWSFFCVSGRGATTWGVVESRTIAQLLRAVRSGRGQCAGPFRQGACAGCAAIAAGMREISGRIQTLRAGSIVGIWTLRGGSFGLYSRRRAPSSRVAGPSGRGPAA